MRSRLPSSCQWLPLEAVDGCYADLAHQPHIGCLKGGQLVPHSTAKAIKIWNEVLAAVHYKGLAGKQSPEAIIYSPSPSDTSLPCRMADLPPPPHPDLTYTTWLPQPWSLQRQQQGQSWLLLLLQKFLLRRNLSFLHLLVQCTVPFIYVFWDL